MIAKKESSVKSGNVSASRGVSHQWTHVHKMLLFISVAIIFVGMWYAPKYFTLLGMVMAVWLVWSIRVEMIPFLFLLFIGPEDFKVGASSQVMGLMETEESSQMVKIVVLIIASLRVVFEGLRRKDLLIFRGRLRMFYMLWLIGIPLALLSSYWGLQNGYVNWTRSARFFVTAGMFFYGIIIAQQQPQGIRNLLPFFEVITLLLLTLNVLGFFAQHLVFLLVGFGASLGVDAIFSGEVVRKIMGCLLVVIAGTVAALGSLTMMATYLLGIIMMITLIPRIGRGGITRVVALAVMVAVPILIGVAIKYGSDYSREGIYRAEVTSSELQGRLLFKIAGDRGPIWYEAYLQILGGPYLLAPSGRPLMLVDLSRSTEKEWQVGAHNALLELTRNGGLLIGGFGIVFLCWQLFQLRAALIKLRGTAFVGLASGVFAVAVVGITTGDFPLDHNVGFWIWVPVGISVEYGRLNSHIRSWIAY